MTKLPTLIVGAVFSIALPGAITTAAARETAPANPKATTEINSDKRICLREDQPITGSILTRRACKTQSQWQADGVDIAKLIASRSR